MNPLLWQTGLANYPMTAGDSALREVIAQWLTRRHALAALDPDTEVLPVSDFVGSRSASSGRRAFRRLPGPRGRGVIRIPVGHRDLLPRCAGEETHS